MTAFMFSAGEVSLFLLGILNTGLILIILVRGMK
jgi:hypothetical protein